MRSSVLALTIAATLFSSTVSAEEKKQPPRFKTLGAQLDVAVPNGAGLSLVVRPAIRWAHLNFGGTYNGMAPGLFTGLTLDPFDWPVTLTLTGEVGGSFRGRVIGLSDAPEASYVYANIWPGIEFGSRDSWRFFIRGGVSYLAGTVYDTKRFVGSMDSSITFTDPTFDGSVAPTAKVGFFVLF